MAFRWLKSKFEDFRTQALTELGHEFGDDLPEDLVEAVAAATAMVAYADHELDDEERAHLLEVFEQENALTDVDLDELFEAFDDYTERFVEDRQAAEKETLAAVAEFAGTPHRARLIVRAALAVASSDGDLSQPEMAAVGKLCDVLGIDPADLGKPATK
ncbi:MAG: TerB family tellurite resistance protein [Geminicoccaceae bacterium]